MIYINIDNNCKVILIQFNYTIPISLGLLVSQPVLTSYMVSEHYG